MRVLRGGVSRWAWALTGLAVLALPLQRLRGVFPTEGFFHSDIAFLPALFHDVAGPGSISSWGLPEAPYFLPDWPLYFVAWLAMPTYTSAMALHGFLQIGLLALVWWGVARYLSPSPALATTIGLSILVLAALHGQVPADYMGVSFAHFGTFIMALGGLWAYFHARFSLRSPRLSLIVLGLITTGAVASDRLFIPMFIAPILAIELASIGRRMLGAGPDRHLVYIRGNSEDHGDATSMVAPLRTSLFVVLALGAGLVFGYGFQRLLVRSSGNYAVGRHADVAARVRFRHVAESFTTLLADWPLYSFISMGAGLVGVGVWLIRRRHTPTVVFGVWFALACVFTLVAEFATASAGWRFHQFIYHVPVLAVGLWLMPLLERVRATPVLAPAALSVSALAWGLWPVTDLGWRHTPEEVICLDQVLAASGSRNGIGNYAASRLAVVHSTHWLTVGTRNSFMAPEQDVHSRQWGRSSADFAIVYPTIFGQMPVPVIRSLSSNPGTDTRCGRWRILDFGPDGIDLDRLSRPGGRAEIKGCWFAPDDPTPSPVALTPPVGQQVPCQLGVPADAVTPELGDYVAAGSRYFVEPGSYRLTAEIDGSFKPIGNFEVVAWNANNGDLLRIESAPLTIFSPGIQPQPTPTSQVVIPTGEPTVVAVEIEVTAQDPEVSLEPRILFRGGENLILDRVTIERIG